MRRVFVILMLAAAVLVGVAPGRAWACSCGAAPESGEVGFVGVVDDVRKELIGSDVTVSFTVEQVLSGAPGAEIRLITSAQGPACGYPFTEGRRYRVWANAGETTSCEGNRDLGFVRPPGMARTTEALLWAGGLALAAAASAIVLIAARRRRGQPR